MIELNPLVIEHHPIKTPRDAPADEFLDCVWQELTDKIHYLPGGIMKGKVSYKACFHDLPMGLQTHIYAPTGLHIREKWSIGGSLPGEPPQPRELGLDLPVSGLYLREDCDMRCNRFLASFVRKNLDAAHKTLVERILKKAQRIEKHRETASHLSYQSSAPSQNSSFQPGSHMAQSRIPMSPTIDHRQQVHMLSPQGDGRPNLADHPAFRNHSHNASWSSTQSQGMNGMQNGRQPNAGYPQPMPGQIPPTKTFVAELPGDSMHLTPPMDNRQSMVSELTGSDVDDNRNSDYNRNSDPSEVSSDRQGRYSHAYNPADYAGVDGRTGQMYDKSRRVSELPVGAQNQQYR